LPNAQRLLLHFILSDTDLRYILLLLLCPFHVFAASNQTELVFEAEAINIGTRSWDGEAIVSAFPFYNKEAVTVNINKVTADCACLVIDFPKVVKPNERSQITVKFNPYAPGPFTKEFSVRYTAEGKSARVQKLKLKGYLHPRGAQAAAFTDGPLEFSERLVEFGEIGSQYLVKRVIELKNAADTAVTLLPVTEQPKHIKVHFVPKLVLEPGTTTDMLVFFDPRLVTAAGEQTHQFRIYFSSNAIEPIDVTVTANVASAAASKGNQPKIKIRPEALTLQNKGQAKPVLASVNVMNSGNAALLVSKVEVCENGKLLSAANFEIPSFNSAIINVLYRPAAGTDKTQIILHTNDPLEPKKVVEVSFY
jgi:hypothetical protein